MKSYEYAKRDFGWKWDLMLERSTKVSILNTASLSRTLLQRRYATYSTTEKNAIKAAARKRGIIVK